MKIAIALILSQVAGLSDSLAIRSISRWVTVAHRLSSMYANRLLTRSTIVVYLRRLLCCSSPSPLEHSFGLGDQRAAVAGCSYPVYPLECR